MRLLRKVPVLTSMLLSLAVVPIGSSAVLAQPAASAAIAKFHPIKINRGDQAPGLPKGITLGTQRATLVDAGGKVACIFELNGTGVKGAMQAGNDSVPNDEALFVETSEGFKSLLRKGDAVLPDHPDMQVFRIQLCSFDEGNIVTMAHLGNKPRIPNPYCVVYGLKAGELQPILQTGVAAADGKLTRFDDLHRSTYGSKGHLTFRSALQADGSPPAGIAIDKRADSNKTKTIVAEAMRNMPSGLWSGTPNNLGPVAASGGPVPDKDGFTFKKIGSFAQNAKGDVVFDTAISKLSGSDFSAGVWHVKDDQKPQLVSDRIEGIPDGATVKACEFVNLNDAGQIAVWVSYQVGSGREKTFGTAIVFIEQGVAKVLIKTGDPIPGTNFTASGFPGLKLSSAGMVAAAYSFGEKGKPQKTGLLVMNPANPTGAMSIMAQHAAAPGTDGVTFGKLSPVSFDFVKPDMVAFTNRLSDRSYGMFFSAKGEPAQPLAVRGMELESDGIKRTVKDATRLAHSSRNHIAENGYLPLQVTFADRKRVTVIAEIMEN